MGRGEKRNHPAGDLQGERRGGRSERSSMESSVTEDSSKMWVKVLTPPTTMQPWRSYIISVPFLQNGDTNSIPFMVLVLLGGSNKLTHAIALNKC